MATDPASLFTIEGTVLGPELDPRPGIRLVAVDVVDDRQAQPKVLISAVSDANGRFSLQLLADQALRLFRTGRDEELGEVARPLASRVRRLAIVAYANAGVVGRLDLPVTLDGLADGYDLKIQTTQSGASVAVSQGEHRVDGMLRDAAGGPIAGWRIEVLHRRLRDEVVITSGQSGSDGSFRLSYDPAPLLGTGAQALAIEVRALEQVSGVYEERVRSSRFCPAPRALEVTLTLAEVPDERTEIERVAALVDTRVGNLGWADLTDDDAELIACETGLPLSQVVLYLRARRLADAAGLPAEALYAVGARGMTMSISAIAAVSPGVLRAELEGAATSKVVPAWVDVDAMTSQVASTMGTRAAADEREPLGLLLATAGIPAALRQTFVVDYMARTGTVAEFWQSFASSHPVEDVEHLKFTLYAGALANDHLPLVAKLEARRTAGTLTSPRDLAAFTLADWQAMVSGDGVEEGAGAPAEYPGETVEEMESLYATALARSAEEAFPTAAIVQRLAKTGRWGLASSYVAEHPGLDFRTTNARQYLADNPAAGLDAAEQETLRQQLSEAQRLFMVAPRFDRDQVAGVMLDAGIHSAQQIAAMGPSAFVETHGGTLGAGVAQVVFDNAHHVTATLATLALKHSPVFNPAASMPAIGGKVATGGDAPPDLEGLLGPLDYCACTHCRSVLSPAAYLVDLLRFLEQRPALEDEDGVLPAQAPFGVLAARRPDLLHTLLDCANTNTPLPAIDLVNEILEREVAGVVPASWPQTTRPASELRAQPEHQLDAAYEVLRTAVYPWTLPFDLAREESETFLGHLGVARHELLAVCGAPSPALDDTIAFARLGLTQLAANIIAGEDVGSSLHELWGVEAWPAPSGNARWFLAQTQLDFEGFQVLALTSYASAGQLGIAYETPCQLDGASITGLDDGRRARIHRFLRLQRALGWSMPEVDAAISALGSQGSNPLDMACLRALARFIALHERFASLPHRELMAWFGDLSVVAPTAGGRSHYEEIFVEVTAQGEVGPLALGQPAVAMSAVMPRLAAALSCSEDAVARLLSLDPARTTTTVANLSWLYRCASLARALELRADELVALVRMSGVVPFAVVGAGALDAVEELVRVRDEIVRARVSVLELDGQLRHQGAEPSGISAAAIAALLVELVRGLQAVRSELDAALDPSRSRVAVLIDQLDRVLSKADADALMAVVYQAPDLGDELPPAFAPFLSESTWNDLDPLPMGGNDPMGDPEHRAGLVLAELVPYLRRRSMVGVVNRKLAVAFALSTGAVEMLLAVVDGGGARRLDRFVASATVLVDAIDFTTQAAALADPELPVHLEEGSGGFVSLAPQFEAVRWLAKAAALIEHARLGDDDLRWLLQSGAAAHGLLSPADLPTETVAGVSGLLTPWLALQRFVHLAQEHMGGIVGLRGVLGIPDVVFRAVLARHTGWEDPGLAEGESSIVAVAAQRGIELPATRTVDALWQLGDAFALARRLGVTAARACTWAVAAPSTATARDIQAAAKARLPAERWPSVLEPLRDRLRLRQRDALVAYVLAREPDARTPEDLFGRLLIDTQISPCAKTSRIKQALSSVQTFVQRVQLNLEPGVNLSSSASAEWQWMSRYRVWEANRKIFLWPENWLQPELRDDKTELFTAFENTLLERELSESSAEAAVTAYVQQLDRIAQLHVAGIYHEREVGPADTMAVDRLHVFARTKAKPYRYFYRMRVDDSYWTPWEEVPLQIEAESVIPAVFRRRLMLFWPSFQRKAPEMDVAPNPDIPLPRHYEIRMSWSTRENGQWGDLKVSDGTVTDENILYPIPVPNSVLKAPRSNRFFFRTFLADDEGTLVIAPSFRAHSLYCGYTPRFYLGGSREDLGTRSLAPAGRYGWEPWLSPKHTEARLRGYVPTPDTSFDFEVPVRSGATGSFTSVPLFRAPFMFTVGASRQYPGFGSLSPFVFQDRVRSFFLVPRHTKPKDDFAANPAGAPPALHHLAKFVHGGVLPAHQAPSGSLVGNPAGTEWSGAEAPDGLQAQVATTDDTAVSAYESWSFELSAFSHPFAERLLSLVRKHGVDGIFHPPATGDGEGIARQLIRHNWNELYTPESTIDGTVIDELDFQHGGAYSVYNWELFFHVPMFVALRLSEEKKFAEAQRWLHFVFDPTEGGNAPTPSRYWKVKPLFQGEVTDVVEQLESLHYEGDDSAKKKLRNETLDEIAQWRKNPFRPHALARLRQSAYQRWVLMRYLDNLVEWGDHLFRQDTIESNNEALQLYVLAAQLLGPRPTVLPAQESAAKTYADVQGEIDEFSNFMAQAENAIPSATLDHKGNVAATKLASATFALHPLKGASKTKVGVLVPPSSHTISLVQMFATAYFVGVQPEDPTPRLYFCVPHNETLLRYWDVVADRLFKLRHCLNIEGVARQLPLFEPPIDPGLLAQAVAAGVDLSAALSDVGASLPHYRFSTMLGLAKELAAEVRGFGSALAEALRNTDAEELAELRARQESKLLVTLRQVREQRIQEGEEAVTSIKKAIDTATHRRDHYIGLNGASVQGAGGFNASLALSTKSAWEQGQISKLGEAHTKTKIAMGLDAATATLAGIPQFGVGTSGLGPHIVADFGGQQLSAVTRIGAIFVQGQIQLLQTSATIAGLEGGYERRREEWTFQAEQAEQEIARLEQDLIGAQLRIEIAKRELADHDAQTANAQAVDAYLRERYTNSALFRWLGSELSRSYFQGYQLAFEIAKQAQRCYRHELGTPDASFIEFGYWDNRRKGLLAGERLLHDLRRMETSYLANNRREYELGKRVSLARIDPFALMQLRHGGSCDVHVPEALFELDHPSHYMRRLRSVRLSVIGNTGPFDSIGATLTLTRSEVRTSATSYGDPGQPVVETGGATQSIATSTGQSDAGVFEVNLRDERYLPFEGKGAASHWRIDLPKALRSFDYGAIADVVLELQYTAREGGQAFASQVESTLKTRLDAMGLGSADYGAGRMWAWSVRSRFPEAWAAFRQPQPEQPHRVDVVLGAEHYPHPLSGSTLRVSEVFVVLAGGGGVSGATVDVTAPGGMPQSGVLVEDAQLSGFTAGPIGMSNAVAFGAWRIDIAAGLVPDPTTLEDLIFVVRYTEGG